MTSWSLRSREARARDTCLLPCDSDSTGFRALQDYTDCDECPIEVLDRASEAEALPFVSQAKDLYYQMREDMDKLEKMFNSEQDASKNAETREAVVEEVNSTLMKKLTNNDYVPDEVKVSVGKNCKNPKAVGEFLLLAHMYNQLSKSKPIKRAAVYARLASPDKAKVKTGWCMKAYYIVSPTFMFFCAFGFQSLMLHVATHFYLFYMDHGPSDRKDSGGQLLDLVGNFVGDFLAKESDTTGAVTEGAVEVPMKLLDASGAIPLMFCALSYLLAIFHEKFNIGLWNKTYLVASVMAIMKGIFDVVTILPDSIGWDSCKERLGPTGLMQMRDMRFMQRGWGAVWGAIFHEVVGGENGTRVRYCADMMISGHTYFAVLFALSAYKQVSFITDVIPHENRINTWVRRVVGFVCCLCILTEVLLVAAARFHYTVDMLASIVLVLLLWDSFTVEQIAADWSEGYHWHDAEAYKPNSSPFFATFFCGRRDPKKQRVLPSGSSLVNMRLLQGVPAWQDPGDLVQHHHDAPHEGPTRQEQIPMLQSPEPTR